MPFKRRRQQNSGNAEEDPNAVRGPSSALTSFLREQGINAEAIRTRYEQNLRRQEQGEELIEIEEDRTGEINSTVNNKNNENNENQEEIRIQTPGLDSDEEVYEDEEDEIKQRARRKRRKMNGNNDDDEDESNNNDSGINYCIECDKKFGISVYSKKLEKYGKVGFLCPSCTKIAIRRERLAKKNEIEARKKRKKVAAALLDKKQFKLPSLQDFCIKIITDNINDVEKLGDIGSINKNKICKILSKNRSLDNKTMTLFLEPNVTELEFWDCSKIDKNSLDKIGSFCPNIEKLNLSMCGQFHNDNLVYFSKKLTKLKHLYLNGPFLINDAAWQNFFETNVGKNLKSFHLENTHRFSSDSLISLLENCGKNLESLSLSRVDGLDNKAVYDLLPHYLSNLKHLRITSPHKEELVDDDMIINLLAVNCDSLQSLILDGCSGLTDKFLTDGIKHFGSNLIKLSLSSFDQITDEGINNVFEDWNINGGLMELNLSRCISLTDKSVYNILKHSNQTLIELNLNSVKEMTKRVFIQLSRNIRLPLLTSFDVGFVRSVDDSVLSIISRIAPKLQILEVYGNNRCTQKAIVRDGLTIIGRQMDSI